MEQHPVPRNITGFQFHLIGDMTLKQFGELLAGAILGYIAIKLPIPSLIAWPLGTVFTLSGIAFAFLPIQERPLDRWLVAFLRSVYSPTQFLWLKSNILPPMLEPVINKPQVIKTVSHISQLEESKKKLQAYLATLPKRPHETIDKAESERLAKMSSLFKQSTTAPTTPQSPIKTASPPVSSQPAPSPKPAAPPSFNQPPKPPQAPNHPAQNPMGIFTAKTQPPQSHAFPPKPETNPFTLAVPPASPFTPPPSPTLQQPAAIQVPSVAEQIRSFESELSQNHVPKEQFLELEKKLIDLSTDRERLASELAEIKRVLLNQPSASQRPPSHSPPPPPPTPVTPPIVSKPLMELQSPNIISGTVKDGKGNLLPNIIITVKDKGSTPQRALKSNRLGQFATSTPLAEGTYTIEVEDPQKIYTFDIIEITLNNASVPPLELLAKSQRELNREKLMKEVFGGTF